MTEIDIPEAFWQFKKIMLSRDKMEVHSYSETAFTITLKNPFYSVESQTAKEVLISCTVLER